jgi:hypothetical protein
MRTKHPQLKIFKKKTKKKKTQTNKQTEKPFEFREQYNSMVILCTMGAIGSPYWGYKDGGMLFRPHEAPVFKVHLR